MKYRTSSHIVMSFAIVLGVVFYAGAGAAHAQVAGETVPATQAAAQARPTERPQVTSQRWVIEFDRSAKSDGRIVFRVWPHGGDPVDVGIDVRTGETENAIARRFRDAFRAALGVKDYRIEVAKNVVRIAAIHGERRFGLEGAATVDGVDIDIGRE